MSKNLYPAELAEIVTALLVKPELVGEKDITDECHRKFMHDIGCVVADYFGGEVMGVGLPMSEYSKEDYLSNENNWPSLSVAPNHLLTSLSSNVWALHDDEGWLEEDSNELPIGTPLTSNEIDKARGQIQSLLSDMGEGDSRTLKDFNIIDWNFDEMDTATKKVDGHVYSVEACLGNESTFKITDEDGNSRMELLIEIDKGVPTLHVGINGECHLLHVHGLNNELVLSPDDSFVTFLPSSLDRYSYNDPSSISITRHNYEAIGLAA